MTPFAASAAATGLHPAADSETGARARPRDAAARLYSRRARLLARALRWRYNHAGAPAALSAEQSRRRFSSSVDAAAKWTAACGVRHRLRRRDDGVRARWSAAFPTAVSVIGWQYRQGGVMAATTAGPIRDVSANTLVDGDIAISPDDRDHACRSWHRSSPTNGATRSGSGHSATANTLMAGPPTPPIPTCPATSPPMTCRDAVASMVRPRARRPVSCARCPRRSISIRWRQARSAHRAKYASRTTARAAMRISSVRVSRAAISPITGNQCNAGSALAPGRDLHVRRPRPAYGHRHRAPPKRSSTRRKDRTGSRFASKALPRSAANTCCPAAVDARTSKARGGTPRNRAGA